MLEQSGFNPSRAIIMNVPEAGPTNIETENELTSEQKQTMIEGVNDFINLFKTLDTLGPIVGSDGKKTYSPEFLKNSIRKLFTRETVLRNITNTYGLRQKVKTICEEMGARWIDW